MPTTARTLCLITLMAIALLPAATDASVKSPASGHASVIAQGVDTLPSGDAVWQIQTRKV